MRAVGADGTVRWQAHVRGMVRSRPALTDDGHLLLATTSGRVYAFRLHQAPLSQANEAAYPPAMFP
ncbi:MAG: PQQ-binding-like beta-propeller repeat protein [Chloroflexaceae bacterium]|nr:PQQ-binding-like beta-propeller repeat protein [Chloroflexaceae bacterium]